jgi:diguanylate cyclase (GGDEF)-like protein
LVLRELHAFLRLSARLSAWGAVWAVTAILSARLHSSGHVLLVWMPSGVAVAAHFATPFKRWPALIAVLAGFQFLTLLQLTGTLAGAVGYTLDSQVEAVLCGLAGIKVLGSRKGIPRTYAHIAGMFGGAMLGSGLAALVALPFQPVEGGHELAWRFLATVLGVLAGTPCVLRVRQWLGIGDRQVAIWGYKSKPHFVLSLAALTAGACGILTTPVAGLMPLLFVGIVFAVIRYGQMAAAGGVLAYAVAATAISLDGRPPVAGWEIEPFLAGLALQAQLLVMLASSLPVAAMLYSRETLQDQLREQNRRLRDHVTILDLAKSLAGIGRWSYNVRTGVQDWSPKMLELNGLSPDLAPDPGDVRALLPDGGAELFGHFAAHREDREAYSFEYRVAPADGDERVLKMKVTNEFDEDGQRVALFAVAMDVTEQVYRERALDQARADAIALAAEAQKAANTDPLTGLANRRASLDWLERLVRASAEAEEPLGLIVFDIDHFKQINDCFGHPTGDAVLKRVAQAARRAMRSEDLVGRVGGEEFVCILPGVDGKLGPILAERLRHAIAENRRGSDGLPTVTVSLGLAIHHPGDTGETLFARADAALYDAKNAGRNRVRLAA